MIKRICGCLLAMVCLFISTDILALEATVSEFGFSGEPATESAITVFTAPESVPFAGDQVRVGFYNIEMFTDGIKDGKNRTEALAVKQAEGAARIIEKMNPDILLISEIENARALDYLNAALQTPYPHGHVVLFGTGSGQQDEKMNIAMLSRIAPESVHEIDFGRLSGPGRPTRGIFRAEFDLGEQHYLLVYSLHLKSNYGNRQRNYAQRVNAMRILEQDALKMIESHPGRQWEMVVLGDFNTDPQDAKLADDPTLKVLSGWSDLWTEHPDLSSVHTVPTRRGDRMREFPPVIFDRILVHPGLREKPWDASIPGVIMEGAETNDVYEIPGKGRHVSDHYPVYIDISR